MFVHNCLFKLSSWRGRRRLTGKYHLDVEGKPSYRIPRLGYSLLLIIPLCRFDALPVLRRRIHVFGKGGDIIDSGLNV